MRDLLLRRFGADGFEYIYHIDQADSSDRVLCMHSDQDVQFDEEFYKHLVRAEPPGLVAVLRLIRSTGVDLGLGFHDLGVLCAKRTNMLAYSSPIIKGSRAFTVVRGGAVRTLRRLPARQGWSSQAENATPDRLEHARSQY